MGHAMAKVKLEACEQTNHVLSLKVPKVFVGDESDHSSGKHCAPNQIGPRSYASLWSAGDLDAIETVRENLHQSRNPLMSWLRKKMIL